MDQVAWGKKKAPTAVPWNLPFGGGWSGGQVNRLVEMPGQRLLPLTANGDFRPISDIRPPEFVAKQPSLAKQPAHTAKRKSTALTFTTSNRAPMASLQTNRTPP
jgi:hypothetical protein